MQRDGVELFQSRRSYVLGRPSGLNQSDSSPRQRLPGSPSCKNMSRLHQEPTSDTGQAAADDPTPEEKDAYKSILSSVPSLTLNVLMVTHSNKDPS